MINALKGMKDLQDYQAALYEKVVKTCEEVAKNYGFTFINCPHLELTRLFKRSIGESSDIVGKEMYEFVDKAGNDVCLRPEGTAGVVRSYIEAKMDKNQSVKRWFYHGSMFRYERPQKGRLREFHQFGVESFGVESVYEDASIILMLDEIFKRLKIHTNLKINSLGCKECMGVYKEKLIAFLNSKDGFCEDCLRRKELNPIRVLDCKNDHCQNLIKNAPKLSENLCSCCKKDYEKLQKILSENGVEFECDEKLVRGLDYYSKSAFEFISDEIGAKAAVAGGGRYDRLIEYLDGKSGYGVGFAMGIERIMAILEQKQDIKNRDGIYICAMDEAFVDVIFKLGIILRKKHKVFINYEAKKLAKHLNQADNANAKIFLCIGEDEMQKEEIFYKNLDSKDTKNIKLANLENEL
ncbi:histidine--tRNA ligase [Campylobacter lari]|uniref:histidine--tRNA ligase n=1 Tax=Campylobacter lari TaxID=201 RepID=UPI00127BBC26|nr:histidine--tRNA ligase [Campylobacter lari]EAJ6452368.1 histidine--tRNA ligase [Campylobacter lari]EAK0770724.1 histidine--tRNA ligase [Campylobacter lari]EAK6012147.1 histidine--tRNA ligase [Campylobacter lari]EAK9996883.1 histidine--tRNA ligase [Campylobacter lari]EDP6858953.1 histidine--tRNA ligase [Campylobacter lari]